jgi:hypothetical protein
MQLANGRRRFRQTDHHLITWRANLSTHFFFSAIFFGFRLEAPNLNFVYLFNVFLLLLSVYTWRDVLEPLLPLVRSQFIKSPEALFWLWTAPIFWQVGLIRWSPYGCSNWMLGSFFRFDFSQRCFRIRINVYATTSVNCA